MRLQKFLVMNNVTSCLELGDWDFRRCGEYQNIPIKIAHFDCYGSKAEPNFWLGLMK